MAMTLESTGTLQQLICDFINYNIEWTVPPITTTSVLVQKHGYDVLC